LNSDVEISAIIPPSHPPAGTGGVTHPQWLPVYTKADR